MKEKVSRLYSPRFIEMFFILFPIIEVLTSILKRNFNVRFSPGIVYKAIFLIYAVIYLVVINKKNRKILSVLMLAIVAFGATNLCVIGLSFDSLSNLSNLITFVLSVMFFYAYIGNGNKIRIESVVYCVLVYCTLIKLAELTGTQLATYRGDLSLGTKGWYYSGNELSAVLSIFLPVVIYYAANTLSFTGIITLFLQIQTLLSIGTKTSLIVPLLVTILYSVLTVINWITNKSLINKKLLCMLLIVIAFMACILPNMASYKFSVLRMKENIKDTSLNSDVDSESVNLKNNSKDGLDNFILNGRSNFLKLQKELYSNTTLLEKLFGVKYQNRLGYDNDKQIKTMEIDIYDIAINFGIVGVVLFYFSIVFCVVSYIYKRFSIKKIETNNEGITMFMSLCIAIAISCIAGHVMTSSTIVIFVAYLLGELSGISELNKGKLNEK